MDTGFIRQGVILICGDDSVSFLETLVHQDRQACTSAQLRARCRPDFILFLLKELPNIIVCQE